ncbi:MAG: hypothetical protein HOH58_01475 [Opitutaceae bacterium]|nr:hypothetical protein [Opitutaceae bacterium]
MNQESAERAQAARVCSGQRFAVWAIMLNLLTVPLLLVPEGALIRAPLILVAIVLAVLGIVRMSQELNISLVLIVLMAMGMVIPFLNLVILLVINARATRYLRDHGYTVGMFGAKPKA